MLVVDRPKRIKVPAVAFRREFELPIVSHSRHQVRLVARSWMMIQDLEYRDPTLLPEHLSRIMVITEEADMRVILKATGRLLVELPELGQVEIHRRIMQLHADIMASYHDSRRRLRAPMRH